MKNETRYTVEAIDAMNRHMMRRQVVWFIFSILLLVYLFVDLFIRGGERMTTLLIVYIVLAFFLFGTMGFSFYSNARRKKESGGVLNTVLNYTFEKDGFKLIIGNREPSEERFFEYGKLKRVADKGRYLLIYVASSSALILDKEGFSEERDVDEVKMLLAKNNVKMTV